MKNDQGEIEYSDKPLDPELFGTIFWAKPNGKLAHLWFSIANLDSFEFDLTALPGGILEVRGNDKPPVFYSKKLEGCAVSNSMEFNQEIPKCVGGVPENGEWFMERIAGSIGDGISLQPNEVTQRVLASVMQTEKIAEYEFFDMNETQLEKIKKFYSDTFVSTIKFYVTLKKDADTTCQKTITFPLSHIVERRGTSAVVSFLKQGDVKTSLCEDSPI